MKISTIILLSILGATILLGLVTIGSIISFRNESVTFEKSITAQVSDMKANYNAYFLKVKESAQVPEHQMEQLKKFYDKIVSGRSAEGAMFKWISENNPQINQETFVELQRIIASGRSEIYNIQKVHIDTVREYNTFLTIFPNNFVNQVFFHFELKEPTLPIVSNVDEIFKTGQDKILQVF